MLLLQLATQSTSFAGSATWKTSPGSGDWNTASNWTPETVPNGLSDTATFASSNRTGISISEGMGTEVNSIVFNPGASAYTINLSARGLSINGGINNNSGVTQTFDLPSFGCIESGIGFFNNATAGSGTTFILEGSPGCPPVGGGGSVIIFLDSSSADHATFVCNGGAREATNPGGSSIYFIGTSSAGNGTFVTNGGTGGGLVHFAESSTASNGTFINYGGRGGKAGGSMIFGETSDAGNAILIVKTGFNGGAGGSIRFFHDSTGGTARVEVFGNGNLDISYHHYGLTIGSIEGSGEVFLGKKNLRVGANNLSTTFSGKIQDGSPFGGGGTGGSLTKVGTGILVLGSANSYTGGTIINGGRLVVNNAGGSGTGTGPVQVNHGKLRGKGTIAGDVTVGNGSGFGAVLSPGNLTLTRGTLTLQSTLTFNSDATYKFGLNSSNVTADRVVALGVTINSGAQFSFTDVGTGTLTSGTVFTVISNTAATPIAGTFSNLADGSTFTSNGNTYKADYQGGDGNDLTLTVVP